MSLEQKRRLNKATLINS